MIRAAKLRYNKGFENAMSIEVLFDRLPRLDEMRFEPPRNALWYAELDGFVQYFSHTGRDENQGGFCGDSFELNMKDGGTRTLRGPWSSRSECANRMGFGPCIEASVTDDPEVFKRGHTFRAGAITIKAAQKALRLIHRTEERFTPVLLREGDQYTPALVKPWGYGFEGGEIIEKVNESEGLEDIPDYGEYMTLEKFVEMCDSGLLVDDDGLGYYATERGMSQEMAVPSDIARRASAVKANWSHVVWFNK